MAYNGMRFIIHEDLLFEEGRRSIKWVKKPN